MSRRRHPNTKHGRKRPDSIAPADDQLSGRDAAEPGSPSSGPLTALARRSDEVDGGAQSSEVPATPAGSDSAAPDRRPKTPPAIDPDAPTSVLPAAELPGSAGGPGGASPRTSEPRQRVSPGDATGYFARQPTPQPGEAIAVPKICPHCGGEYETDARFCPKDGTALRPKGGGDALIGRVIADRYHVLKVVGEGGMGRIYLAEHVRMNRQCALKVMRPSLVHDADSAARFGREASNAARIIHPNVAAVFDYGETEGLVYLVMEYVDGQPLGEILQRGGALKPHRAVEIAKQVADALTAAHELGIVHRDLKPDNIIVTKSKSGREVAKVVDFGIAKAVAESPDRRLTETGLVIGTPEFMSPEQLVGDPADARSDIYSLGCIFYLMLVGSPAADAPTRDAMLKRRLNELPPHPSHANKQLPSELDAIVVKMLAVAPAERYQTAAELRAALDEVRLPPDPDAPLASSGASRTSLDPSKAPTVEVAVASFLPSWAPAWMKRPTIRRAARTALMVAGVALVGGAAVGAAVTVALRRDRPTEPNAASARADSVRLSGARSGGAMGAPPVRSATQRTAGSGATSAAAETARGSGATRSPGRPAGVAGRSSNDTGAPRSADGRRAVFPTSRIPAPILRFRAAVESGDVQQIEQAYPGLTPSQRKMWENVFKQSKPESAEIRDVDAIRSTEKDVTIVDFVMAVTFSDRATKTTVAGRPARYRARLKREGPNLVLQSLTDATAPR